MVPMKTKDKIVMHRIVAIIIFIVMIAITLLNAGCAKAVSNAASAGTQVISQSIMPTAIKNVDVEEAYKIIQNNNPNLVVLDVRTSAEYNSGHIANAINIDVSSASFNSTVSQMGQDKTYLVYCQMGGRSATATKTMQQLGFKDLLNLNGGLNQWKDRGYLIVK